MKRFFLAVSLLVAGACSNTMAPKAPTYTISKNQHIGDSCTDAQGRSGYLIASGDKLVCQAS